MLLYDVKQASDKDFEKEFESLPNFKEIKPQEFVDLMTCWSPTRMAYISGRREDGQHFSAEIFHLDQMRLQRGGVGVMRVRGGPVFFEYRACDHEFKQQNLGNCYNRYTCVKCGCQHDVDSSD